MAQDALKDGRHRRRAYGNKPKGGTKPFLVQSKARQKITALDMARASWLAFRFQFREFIYRCTEADRKKLLAWMKRELDASFNQEHKS